MVFVNIINIVLDGSDSLAEIYSLVIFATKNNVIAEKIKLQFKYVAFAIDNQVYKMYVLSVMKI